MIVSTIRVPEGVDAEEFETFLREEYLPGVRMLPTRVGQILAVRLWRPADDHPSGPGGFVLEADYSGFSNTRVRVDDEDLQTRFDAYGAVLERLGAYELSVALPPTGDSQELPDGG